MKSNTFPRALLTAGLLAALSACTGGSDQVGSTGPSCLQADSFCLVSCNLGCTVSGGCQVTQIAQNQPISLEFSAPVDPASVTAGSISIRTAGGVPPVGSLFVNGNLVVFQPQPRLIGGQTRFGFLPGETYTLTLPGVGTGATLRSTSGDALEATTVCTLRVTEGLIDLNGRPPEAELILPVETRDVPVSTPIVVRFSELIDLSGFQGQSAESSPIEYKYRRTLVPDPSQPDNRICDPGSPEFPIRGVPVATVLQDPDNGQILTEIVLQPDPPLPRQVCVDIVIGNQVRDLAGVPAEPANFRFFTEVGQIETRSKVDTFGDASNIDTSISAGTFVNGRATPAQIGGDGRHGSFNPALGQRINDDLYLWDTTGQTIPASSTLLGQQSYDVTDGNFYFTDLEIPAGTEVRFVGPFPPVIRVRGRVQIDGTLSVAGGSPDAGYNGKATPATPAGWNPAIGETGAGGGAGGGQGGQGGDGCELDGDPTGHSGRLGEAIVAPMASGYFSDPGRSATGGGGGPVFPVSANQAQVVYSFFGTISAMVGAGGGGGAFLSGGEIGEATATFQNVPSDLGPPSAGGVAVSFLNRPASGVTSLEHFLVGGGGGGGGGSAPTNMSVNSVTTGTPMHGGSAGCGGGGAVALRVGGSLGITSSGRVSARGGAGVEITSSDQGPPAPGGGGSGGSILLQVDQIARFTQEGTLDVRGGAGSTINNPGFTGQPNRANGGAGGFGFARVEGQGSASSGVIGTVQPLAAVRGASVAELDPTERDDRSGFTSLWVETGEVFPPQWLYYEVEYIDASGQTVVYGDATGATPADNESLPIRIYFQGRTDDPATGGKTDPGPWRDFVNSQRGQSISLEGATDFRYMVIFNDTTPGAAAPAVTRVEVFYRS